MHEANRDLNIVLLLMAGATLVNKDGAHRKRVGRGEVIDLCFLTYLGGV